MNDIKTIRQEKKLTQKQVANLLGISLRSYIAYENDKTKEDSIKYNFILEKLQDINRVDEDHGVLELEEIIRKCKPIFDEYHVHYCILFGSYAKGKATESSDLDLLISSDVKGLKYYGMIEKLRNALHKRIDALNTEQLRDNMELTNEILKDGIRIYG